MPGDVQFLNVWYMCRRKRPMVPARTGTPMPEKEHEANIKAIFSVCLRPWVLDVSYATDEVPQLLTWTECLLGLQATLLQSVAD